jgi:hypothetical protein
MFKLVPLDQDIFDATQSDWTEHLRVVEDHFSTWGYYSVLDNADNFAGGGFNDAMQYALIPLDSLVAEALIVFTHKLPNQLQNPECAIKVLQIRTHPRHDSRVPETEGDSITQRRSRTIKVLSILLTDILALTYEKFPANKMKIHVNKQAESSFFSHLEENLNSDGEKNLAFRFDSHKNWFEIIKNQSEN